MRIVVLIISLLFSRHFLLAQQCNFSPQLTIPVADQSRSNAYGTVSDSFGEFMVVAEYYNDSLEFNNGIVHLYQLTTSNKWKRIAVLAPSDPQESMGFGMFLSINDATITIIGNRYDAQGKSHHKIYVFEQDSNGKWNSGTESYQIEISAELHLVYSMDLSENYLAVGFVDNYRDAKVAIYSNESGQFSLKHQIIGPQDVDGENRYFGERISLTDDLLVVASPSHRNDSQSFENYGLVFVYERAGTDWSSTPIAKLGPSDRSAFHSIHFGYDVQISATSILVAARQHVPNSNSKNTVYVYARPSSGWIGELTENAQIANGHNGYFYWDMVTDGTYLFLPNDDWTAIAVHKRTGASWEDHTSIQTIPLPPSTGNNWGRSITLAGNHFLVGIGANDDRSYNHGTMVDYIPNTTWENGFILNQQFVDASVNAAMDEYGKDIAVSQNVMAVSAVGDDDGGEYSGAVYVYEFTSSKWVQTAKVKAHDAESFAFYGQAVALGQDNLFVGAIGRHSYHSDNSIAVRETGAVYVYKKIGTNWQFDEIILPPTPQLGGRFGQEITYCNGYIAVAEYPERGTGMLGYVHLYKEDASGVWKHIATLTPSDHLETETFGRSIAMDDSTIVVGTGGVQSNIYHYMKAYIFRKKGEWHNATEDAQLSPSAQAYNDRFGVSVALHGDQIVVGAPGYSSIDFTTEHYYKGTVYVFLKPSDGWSGTIHETAQLSPSNPSRNGSFGTSVAIDEDDIYVGAPHTYFVWNVVDNFNNDDGHLKPGTVYHYYKKDGWITTAQEDEQVPAVQPERSDMFGVKLVLQDGFLFIGAVFDDTDAGYKTGSVMTFPQASLITSVVTSCAEDGPVSLHAIPWGGIWSVSGYPEQIETSIQLPAGSYTATYSFEGCPTATVSFDVISSGRIIQDVSPAEIEKCFYESTPLYLNSNVPLSDYVWYYKKDEPDNYVKIEEGKDALTASNPGYYDVELKHPTCNPHRENFHVSNEAVIDVIIEKPPVLCSDDIIQLQAEPQGGTWSAPASPAGQVHPATLSDGQYPVDYTVTTVLGCAFTKSEVINVDKLVKPELTKSNTHLCVDEPIKLAVLNKKAETTLTWFNNVNPNAGISSSDEIAITVPGTYFATVSNHSCTLHSDLVLLESKPDSLYVPNVITPNGDSKNEFFEVINDGVADMQLILYNRYGERIFSAHNPDFKWDARDTSSGIYYWHLQYISCSNERRELKGFVHIIH